MAKKRVFPVSISRQVSPYEKESAHKDTLILDYLVD